MPALTEKIRIGGIKISERLTLVNFPQLSGLFPYLSHLCRVMSRNRVNLPFITSACTHQVAKISCCVAAEDEDRVRNLLESDNILSQLSEFVPNTGLLSLFPTRSGLNVLGGALSTFAQAGLPMYGATSSLSSLVFVTDFAKLLQAVEAFKKNFDIPPHRAPIKQDFQVRQSSQVKMD